MIKLNSNPFFTLYVQIENFYLNICSPKHNKGEEISIMTIVYTVLDLVTNHTVA